MATGQLLAALRGPSFCFVQGQHFDLLESPWPDWLWIEAALRGSQGSKPGVDLVVLISPRSNFPQRSCTGSGASPSWGASCFPCQ